MQKVAYKVGEPLPFGTVMFPLRYDIIAQGTAFASFFELFGYDLDKFVEGTRDSIMHKHLSVMMDVHAAASKPYLAEYSKAKRARRIEKYHRGNLDKLLAIHKSISVSGWVGTRLHFKSLRDPMSAATILGDPVPPCLFLTNGQHRCEALWALGHTEFAPNMWCTTGRTSDFRPLDVTSFYIKAELMSEQDYIDFAGLRFSIPQKVDTIGKLSKWTAETGQPGWLKHYIRRHWYDS
jgi:hypothetical protein